MSAPIHADIGLDEPLLYAPRWARRAGGAAPEISPLDAEAPIAPADESEMRAAHMAYAPAPAMAEPPPMASGIGGHNINLPPPRLRPFESDVAVKDLRRRLALEPEMLPEPPMRRGRQGAVPWLARFFFVLILAASATFGITLLTMPHEQRPRSDTITAVAPPLPLPEDSTAVPRSTVPARLIVENQRAFANEPLLLGVSLADAFGGETLTLVGLASGTKFSAGVPLGLTGWQMSARDLGEVYAYAPKDFVGAMDAAIDLRSPRDRLMDSQVVRLEWLEKNEKEVPALDVPKPSPNSLEPAEIAVLLKRGQEFLRSGDVAAARLFLRRAASAGNAEAALALGVTFDPVFLAQQGVLGPAPDPTQARAWYAKAAELGSGGAARRLEQLTTTGGH